MSKHNLAWREKLDWDGARAPSNVQIKAAMQAEIDSLHHKLQTARSKVEYWRKLTYAYKNEVVKLKRENAKYTKPKEAAAPQRSRVFDMGKPLVALRPRRREDFAADAPAHRIRETND